MRDYTEDIQETANRFRLIGEAAFIAIALSCGVVMVGVVGAVVFS